MGRRVITGLSVALAALALLATVPASAAAQAGCTKPAKRFPGAADPGVTPFGTGYLLVSTSLLSQGLPIRASSDGIHWCPIGKRIFSRIPRWIERRQAKGRAYWAPEIYRDPARRRLVVLYAAFRKRPASQKSRTRRRCIGAAVSRPDPRAPSRLSFRDLGPSFCRVGNRYIDPSLFFAPGGRTYLLYKEDPIRPGRTKRIMIRRFNLASGKVGPRRREILRAAGGWEGGSVESPTMIFHHRRYYLFYSGNDYTTKRYGVGVAVSDRPGGRFARFGGNPIVGAGKNPRRCGVGHQAVTETSRHGWRIYFHARDSCGRPRYLTCRGLDWGPTRFWPQVREDQPGRPPC